MARVSPTRTRHLTPSPSFTASITCSSRLLRNSAYVSVSPCRIMSHPQMSWLPQPPSTPFCQSAGVLGSAGLGEAHSCVCSQLLGHQEAGWSRVKSGDAVSLCPVSSSSRLARAQRHGAHRVQREPEQMQAQPRRPRLRHACCFFAFASFHATPSHTTSSDS